MRAFLAMGSTIGPAAPPSTVSPSGSVSNGIGSSASVNRAAPVRSSTRRTKKTAASGAMLSLKSKAVLWHIQFERWPAAPVWLQPRSSGSLAPRKKKQPGRYRVAIEDRGTASPDEAGQVLPHSSEGRMDAGRSHIGSRPCTHACTHARMFDVRAHRRTHAAALVLAFCLEAGA